MTARRAARPGVYAELAGTPQAPREARALVSHALGDDHPQVHDARLVISELVSNAITHSQSGQPGGTVAVALEIAPHSGDVHIQVRDAGGPNTRAPTAHGPDREHGRGLAIVTALAADWGTETGPAGRATWCRLSTSQRTAATTDRVPEREAG